MGYCAKMTRNKFFVPTEHTGIVMAKMRRYPYDLMLDRLGNIIRISFRGDKVDGDLEIFKTIAPYVRDGSSIEMLGEDGERWKWVFENGNCHEVRPKIIWDEEGE